MGLRVRLICTGMLAISLSACSFDPASQAWLDAYRGVQEKGGASAGVSLDPAYRYLKVRAGENEAFLALGYIDESPDGPVEVWYSADRNVLKLRNGRVVGAAIAGVVDWGGVSFQGLPNWGELGEQAVFVRLRDASPGYRYGLREEVRLTRVAAPSDSGLLRISPSSLIWYEERVDSGPDTGLHARYALEKGENGSLRVIYGEQCLTREYCIAWQNWPSSSEVAH